MQPRIGIAGPFMVHDEKKSKLYCTQASSSWGTYLRVTGNLLVKITHLKLGQVGTSSGSKRHVTICAELDGPHEFMTMTVRVPNSGSERDDREYGIARAKEFARGFSNLSSSLFPAR
jgi:hypothetical protein